MNRPCESCNSIRCDGIECYLTDPVPEDEETISTLTLEDCRRIWGKPLSELKRTGTGGYWS